MSQLGHDTDLDFCAGVQHDRNGGSFSAFQQFMPQKKNPLPSGRSACDYLSTRSAAPV
jgi:hypothetical protein